MKKVENVTLKVYENGLVEIYQGGEFLTEFHEQKEIIKSWE